MHVTSIGTWRKTSKVILIVSILLVIVSIVGFMGISHMNVKLNLMKAQIRDLILDLKWDDLLGITMLDNYSCMF